MEIGVDLAREATIGLLDVIRRGRLGKTENLIVVALCCRHESGDKVTSVQVNYLESSLRGRSGLFKC